jgi:jumonji domain-containing protein 7
LDIIKEEVTIAVTEDGLADSVQTLEGGEEVFVKPLNEEMALSDFFDRLSELSLHLEYLY